MGFDPSKAELTNEQMQMGQIIDRLKEIGESRLDDGFGFDDLVAIPEVAPIVVQLVAAVSGKSGVEIANLLIGAGAAFFNDNLEDFSGQEAA